MCDAIACQLQTTSRFSYCADKSNTHLPHCPHPISNSSSSLTHATTFSQPPQVKDYAGAAEPPSTASSSEGQGPKTPIQGSNALGLAVTASSCANEFNAGGALGGDGSTTASSVAHPPSSSNDDGNSSHDDEPLTFLQHQHVPCPQPNNGSNSSCVDDISGRDCTLNSNSSHVGYASTTAASTATTIIATSLHKLRALLLPLHRHLGPTCKTSMIPRHTQTSMLLQAATPSHTSQRNVNVCERARNGGHKLPAFKRQGSVYMYTSQG